MKPDQTQNLTDQAKHDGARVGRMGLSLELNPNEHGDILHDAWRTGWDSGMRDFATRSRK